MEAKLLRATAFTVQNHNTSRSSRLTTLASNHRCSKHCSFRFPNSKGLKNGIRSVQAVATSPGMGKKSRVDETESYTLDGIRSSLIRQEDSIIFGLVGRYNSPDEHPFFPNEVPQPMLPPLQYPQVLHPVASSININIKVWDMYFKNLLPRLVKEGDDGNCGSTAVCDTLCLQALSKRIHYGKFVAEAKYQASPEVYKPAIVAQDKNKLMELLTYPTVEEAIKNRVEVKTRTYGQEVTINAGGSKGDPVYKINPSLVAELYGDWIMPLTKEVQVQYLLRRLELADNGSGANVRRGGDAARSVVDTVYRRGEHGLDLQRQLHRLGSRQTFLPRRLALVLESARDGEAEDGVGVADNGDGANVRRGGNAAWSLVDPVYRGCEHGLDLELFVYDRNQMNVLEVNKTDYESCNADHPLHNWTTGAGRDVVPLNVTKTYYIISGKGFCYGGMKVAVTVEKLPPPPKAAPVKSGSPGLLSSFSFRGQIVVPALFAIAAAWESFLLLV
nr:chorismate mutase 1, chloroplastic [Ipomoea batatas]